MLTRSNCTRYGDWPLMMVGGLTETCWVFNLIYLRITDIFNACGFKCELRKCFYLISA